MTFEPSGLGEATGRGAEPPAYRSASLVAFGMRSMNSLGVRSPSQLWANVVAMVLPCSQHRASLVSEVNSVSLSNLPRSHPLKLSIKAFWVGLLGAM